ncbi:MAG: ATP-grasp domain-containing protein [Acidobacteria bacterium]|nr:ATP-grasp domain-containing protein [Acidobacteriota bacterium]
MVTIDRILIANRGEIARRIAIALLEKGIVPVLPVTEKEYSQAVPIFKDCHMVMAPDSIYLDSTALVTLAKAENCQAVHPGYGFLAENADFATLCERSGLIFIGPPAGAMSLMGHKERAREIAKKVDVSPVPGFSIDGLNELEIKEMAEGIGFPVLVKASMGGGGKGMRRVENPEELFDAIRMSKSESAAYFGSDDVFIEKYILRPRHIEIQIFSFPGGRTVYVGERECTIQRRHQKIIEESPSPVVDWKLRRKMGEAAVRIADIVNYVGAGTVEFIVDEEMNFYFLEMNTRIQVEHPVTEEVFGVDLVAWQIEEALGIVEAVPQGKLRGAGHAIEFRIYAEDPDQGFMPSPGKILLYREPGGPGIRVESAVTTGSEIFADFDPMIAKVVVKGHSRRHALERARWALSNFVILGVTTNREFLMRILEHPAFQAGELDTGFIEQYRADLVREQDEIAPEMLLLAAALRKKNSQGKAQAAPGDSHDFYPPVNTRIP